MTPLAAVSLALAAGLVWYFATLFDVGVEGSIDGRFYLEAGMRQPVPRVYAIKWFLPALLRGNANLWQLTTAAHLIGLPAAVVAYALAAQLEPWRALVAGLLTLGLSGVWRINVKLPVLVDAPALFWSALAAASVLAGWTALGLVLAALAASIKEPAPVFIAAASASPWPLVALLIPVVAWLLKPDIPAPEWCSFLVTKPGIYLGVAAKKYTNVVIQLAPWGPALFVALAAPVPTLWLSLAAAYGVAAGGYVGPRYYQWGFLPIVVCAAAVVPSWAAGGLVLAQLFNPWRGTGL